MKSPSDFCLLLLCALLLGASIADCCLLENDRNSVYVSVFENLKIGSTLAELPVIGRSFGPDANIQLKLAPGQEDVVELNAAAKKLILKKELDREKGSNKLEIVVQCRSLDDKTFPQLNISTFVTVKDVNDNAPQFDQSEYRIQMPEELPKDTIVFVDFEATDDDQPGPNSYVNYRITRGAEYLVIPDPTRPVIVVGGRVDFEKIQKFEVEIEASDAGTPQLRSTVSLHVTVLDIDDQNPVFGSQSYYANSMQENAFEVLPEPIKAKDGDTLNAPIRYELSGAHHESFTIDSKGVVRLLNDTVISTTLLVHAFQTDRSERAATAMLRIAEQSSIEFEHSLYSIQVTSAIPIDSEILRVRATSTNSRLRYSILNDEGDVLRIEERTGRIFLKSPLTAEKYAFKISATDGKTRGWSRLELAVDRTNSHFPEFDQAEYLFEMKNGNLIGQVRATDADKDDTVVYRLLNFQSTFDIDDDGMLSHRAAVPQFDLTRQPDVYEVVVLAEDTAGHRQFVTVVVNSLNTAVFTTTVILTVAIGALLVVLFCTIVFMLVRRCISCMTNARRNKVCWMSKTGDNGVVISGSVPTEIESRTCSSARSSHSKSRYSPSVAPSEEKDREVADVYASTSVASPARIRGAHLVPVTVSATRGGPPTIYF